MLNKRITPENVQTLKDNEIFVFGSNVQGMHYGGAARHALEHFGAQMVIGEGLTGKSYALPTMEGEETFQQAVERFLLFAQKHPEYTFFVTRVGCGIAGYFSRDVAPWFVRAAKMKNVFLPEDFWQIIETMSTFEENVDYCFLEGGDESQFENVICLKVHTPEEILTWQIAVLNPDAVDRKSVEGIASDFIRNHRKDAVSWDLSFIQKNKK